MKYCIKKAMIIVLSMLSLQTSSQTNGEIRGMIIDEMDNPIFGGVVRIYSDSVFVGGSPTNVDGVYTVKNVLPGTYDVHVEMLGYQQKIIKGVVVSAGQKVHVDQKLKPISNEIKGVEIIAYEKSPVNEGFSAVKYITLEKLNHGAIQKNDIIGIISTSSSDIIPTDDGKDLYVRGSRRGTTQYIVDGMKTIGEYSVPGSAIANIVVITGGVSAEYGDLTGGVIVITTKDYMVAMRQKRLMYESYYEEEEYKKRVLVTQTEDATR